MFVASWLRHQAGRAAHRSTNIVLPCGQVGKFSVADLGGLVLWYQIQLLRWPGFIAGAFACGYGIARTIAEFYRVPDAHIGYLGGFLTMGILLSLPMLLAGIAAMVWSSRRSAGAAQP